MDWFTAFFIPFITGGSGVMQGECRRTIAPLSIKEINIGQVPSLVSDEAGNCSTVGGTS